MNFRLLISPAEVIDYAFATGEYVADGAITESAILAAQQRYMLPLLGGEFTRAIIDGEYEPLREEYIAPTLALLARIESNLEAYPPTSQERERAKLFLRTLTDHLNDHRHLFVEYLPQENVMNRCQIVGGFVI